MKNLKESTRQRFVAIELDFPPVEIETEVVAHEAGIDAETARAWSRSATPSGIWMAHRCAKWRPPGC